jgi:hypothetical protein
MTNNLINSSQLDDLVERSAISAANGFMNKQYSQYLALLKQGNCIPSTTVNLTEEHISSRFEKQMYQYIFNLNPFAEAKRYGLNVKDFGREFPNFKERFNNITFNLGRGISYEDKVRDTPIGGFTPEAIELESQVTEAYARILKNVSGRGAKNTLSTDYYVYQSFGTESYKKISGVLSLSEKSRSALIAVGNSLIEHKLSIIEDGKEKDLIIKSYKLAMQYSGYACADLTLLSSRINDDFNTGIPLIEPYYKPVELFRQHVLLHASNGMFDLSVYQNYFYNALKSGEVDFNAKVLLPSQYVFHAVITSKDRLKSEGLTIHPDDTLALIVGAILRFDRLINNDSLNAYERLTSAVDKFGAMQLFSSASRS